MKSILVSVSLFLASCGSNVLESVKPKQAMPTAPDVSEDKPMVYNFSGDFCTPCKKQAAEWVKYLGGKDSTKVKIKTFVIDLQPDEIPQYVASKRIPWEVVSDTERVFRKYCTGINAAVPCNMVVKGGKVVYLRAASVSPQTLEKYTGSWK